MIFHPQLQISSKPQQQSRALLISDLTSQQGIMALQFSMDLIVRSIVVATIIPPPPTSPDLTIDNAMKNMNMIFCKNLLENDAPIY